MKIFSAWVLWSGLTLWVLQYIIAQIYGWLTPTQMRSEFPDGSILPLVWHGGIWLDLPLTFLLAYIVSKYGMWWSPSEWLWMGVVGTLASAFMLASYRSGTTPEAHVQNHRLTPLGYVLFVYMSGAFTILLLFFIYSSPTREMVIAVGIFLVVLITVGNHFVLGIVKPEGYFDKPLRSLSGWATVGVGTAILVVATVIRFY